MSRLRCPKCARMLPNMIIPTRHKVLPVIVDTPTPNPRLGFENYVSGIAAAIMGGEPARYTVGLYGPWGSGKSSLLAAIHDELGKWAETGQVSSAEQGADSPIVVEFDAWRYADKGALVLSMLLRIQMAVDRRTKLAHINAETKKKLVATLDVVKSVVQSIKVSAWGVDISVRPPSASSDGIADLSSTLMPFEQLGKIGAKLPPKQRIVILVDDLDRCSPKGVISVLEAIHVLTDITGVVFVLALDYEYLTAAILSEYPTTDPDRFIEKIVQVPFHVPAPKIEDADMVDIIPTWSAIQDWMDGVTDRDLRSIMRIGLRSNPRQIKRLVNTFLLFAYMHGSENGPKLDKALALKVLGLQVAWPAVFSELLRELAKDFNRPDQGGTRGTFDVGQLDAYARWYSDDESSDEADESADIEEASEIVVSGRERRNGRRGDVQGDQFTPESRERLRSYLEEVLIPTIPAVEVWNIMVMAQVLVAAAKGEAPTEESAVDRLAETLSKSDEAVLKQYKEIVKFTSSLPHSNATESPSYFRISREINNKTRVFGFMRVRPTQRTVRVQIRFGIASEEAIGEQNFQAEFVKTLSLKSGQQEGLFIVRADDGLDVLAQLWRILEFAHANVKP